MIFPSIGERINYCRSLIGKTRKEVSDEIGIVSLPTLSRWELNITKVPTKKIDFLINYFSENNIFISKEWLVSGAGHSPIDGNLQDFNKNNFDDIAVNALFSLKREIKNFWFSQVSNNFFSPFASFGDYIGGILVQSTKENFIALKDKICFFSDDKEVFAGILRVSDQFFVENIRNERMAVNVDCLVGEMQWLSKRP